MKLALRLPKSNDRRVYELYMGACAMRTVEDVGISTVQPVPNPEDLLRAARSAYMADRIDLVDYLMLVDAIPLPRVAFIGSRLVHFDGGEPV